MSKISEAEYKSRLNSELERFGLGVASSANVKTGPNKNGSDEAWWLENLKKAEAADTDRSKAYLRTYEWLASEGKMWAVGIPLRNRGRVWLDRSVIKRLLDQKFLEFVDAKSPYFVVTQKGKDWIGD